MSSPLRFFFLLLDVYSGVIILRAIVSWFRPVRTHPAVQLLIDVTEPILGPLRSLVPPRFTLGLDLSPVLALIAIQFLKRLLLSGGG